MKFREYLNEEQKYKSAGTSINSSKLPATFGKLDKMGAVSKGMIISDNRIDEKLFTGVHDQGEYFEVYKNPTPSEIKDIVKTEKKKNDISPNNKESIYNTVRGGIDEDADIYCFAVTLLHHDAQKKAGIKFHITFEYDTQTDIMENVSFFNLDDTKIKRLRDLGVVDNILSTFPDMKKLLSRGLYHKETADKLFSVNFKPEK